MPALVLRPQHATVAAVCTSSCPTSSGMACNCCLMLGVIVMASASVVTNVTDRVLCAPPCAVLLNEAHAGPPLITPTNNSTSGFGHTASQLVSSAGAPAVHPLATDSRRSAPAAAAIGSTHTVLLCSYGSSSPQHQRQLGASTGQSRAEATPPPAPTPPRVHSTCVCVCGACMSCCADTAVSCTRRPLLLLLLR